MKIKNVLSLFDGMSCGRIALDRAGVNIGKYYASELDKYAITVAQANWPENIQLGDVTKWREWDIDWSSIDLLIGGSPCQGFSFAGKQAGTSAILNEEKIIVTDRETYLDLKEKGAEFLSQSYLFWEYVLCLDHVRAHNKNAKFLLENVKMKKEILNMISEAIGCEPILINSALVSAQNRQRYYWSSMPIDQPYDKFVLLNDILLDAGIVDRMVGRKINPETGCRDDYNQDLKAEQRFETRSDSKSGCLTTVQKDNLVIGEKYFVSQVQLRRLNVENVENGGARVCFQSPGQNVKKSECLQARDYKGISGRQYFTVAMTNGRLRKLTPVECERLQTVPDNYTNVVERVLYSLYNYKEIEGCEDIYLCDVKQLNAKETQQPKSMANYALCTTRDLLGMSLLSFQRSRAIEKQNVNIAIEKLEKKEAEQEGCVIDITRTGLDMATLYTRIKSEGSWGREGIKSALVIKTSTGKLLRITSEDCCQDWRLFTILIAIKLIMELRICTYVMDRAHIQYSIDSLKELQGNLLSVGLSSLKMETTKQTVSSTQRYKMLGNGWTVDVIAHIFEGLKS